MFNVEKVRQDFPILNLKAHGHSFVYLDNAATSQKPRVVIETLDQYYRSENANIHRGFFSTANAPQNPMNQREKKYREFINARKEHEIISYAVQPKHY